MPDRARATTRFVVAPAALYPMGRRDTRGSPTPLREPRMRGWLYKQMALPEYPLIVTSRMSMKSGVVMRPCV
jgi:hypothetical protein